MSSDDFSIEISQRQLAFIALPTLIIGLSAGYFAGAYQTNHNYQSTYEGFIDNEHYEESMVGEAVDAYNRSKIAFEKNNTEVAFQFYRDGTKMTWALMNSHDEDLYGKFHRYAWTNCLFQKETGKENYLDRCKGSVDGLLTNLENLEEQKFGNKTETTSNKSKEENGGVSA